MHKYKTHLQYRGSARARKSADEIVAALLTERFADATKPVVIAVGGPGGTGKSTFCGHLARQLSDVAVVDLDDYRLPRSERHDPNLYGSHPKANRMDLLEKHLGLIREGKAFNKPVYDPVSGENRDTETFRPARFNILDGEVSTYRQFRDLVDFAIFIDSDWKTQLTTRTSRDIERHGFTWEKAISVFLQSNLREFAMYGAESKNWADAHLYCKEDYRLVVESVAEELYQRYEALLEQDLTTVDLSGLIVPVLTPFTDSNRVDQEKFIEHLEFLAGHDARRVLINGTTGEFFSLAPDERKTMLTLARRYFPGVVVFQAGRESLAQTEREARWADEYGADAIMALPPYYFAGAPADGLVEYFNHLGRQLDIPLLIYNFPVHTNNPMTPDILRRVDHFGLKDSSGDLSLIPATPHYFVGADDKILEARRAGAHGFVSATSNVAPDRYVAMERALADEDASTAESLQLKIAEFRKNFVGPHSIARMKVALSRRVPGYPARVRLPLVPVADEEAASLAKLMDAFHP